MIVIGPLLRDEELKEWLALAETVEYTTVRGSFRMAPLSSEQCSSTPTIKAFLGGRDPYGAYILRYGVGTGKVVHTDPGMMHERLICMLKPSSLGGVLRVEGKPCWLEAGDACIFRADILPHSVSDVEKGERIALTVGRPV